MNHTTYCRLEQTQVKQIVDRKQDILRNQQKHREPL
jgi:hypothetical protein